MTHTSHRKTNTVWFPNTRSLRWSSGGDGEPSSGPRYGGEEGAIAAFHGLGVSIPVLEMEAPEPQSCCWASSRQEGRQEGLLCPRATAWP